MENIIKVIAVIGGTEKLVEIMHDAYMYAKERQTYQETKQRLIILEEHHKACPEKDTLVEKKLDITQQ